MLFLLSTGEEKDLDTVRKWARSVANRPHTYAWYLGYGGIPLCEYYLRTGDKEVIPGIQKWADNAVKGQYLDGWAGRGGVPSVTYGMGHLNAGGTAVVTFLLLAKECGVDVPDRSVVAWTKLDRRILPLERKSRMAIWWANTSATKTVPWPAC